MNRQQPITGLKPNIADIQAHLYSIAPPARRRGYSQTACIEIAYGKDDPDQAQNFSVFEIKLAAEFAAARNMAGDNVYVGATIRDWGRDPPQRRSSAEEYGSSNHAWFDFDRANDAARVDAFLREHDIRLAFTVTTGTIPHLRAHGYIKVADIRDATHQKQINAALQRALGTDAAVVDPARVLRLAGTITYPNTKKKARNYVSEVATFRTFDDPPTYHAEQLLKLLGDDVSGAPKPDREPFASGDLNAFERHAADVLHADGRLTYDDIRALLQKHENGKGDGWHNDMLAVTWELLIRGYDPLGIRLIIEGACKDGFEDRDIGPLIDKKWAEFQADKRSTEASPPAETKPQQKQVDPIDLWGKFEPPSLAPRLLPDIIERFAFELGMDMGADPSGIAMAALVTSGAAIPDNVKLQVKRHNAGWRESARLWVALVGPPSSKKTPIMAVAARPLRNIDADQARGYAQARAEYETLTKEDKLHKTPPKQVRSVLQDVTIEAAQEILKDSPDGLLCYQDELAGWFGAMDKYSAGRGSAKDRAFWLSSYNGGAYSVHRVGRGAVFIENLSISLIGGIQPEPIREIAGDTVDDGLLQRLVPMNLKPAVVGRDEEAPEVTKDYDALIHRLHGLGEVVLRFDDDAQRYRQELEAEHLKLQSLETVHRKLAAHIGKYDGLFARLSVIWHCVQHVQGFGSVPEVISEKTARRVGAFLHGFLLPHAIGFYANTLGLANDHDSVTAVAGYILTHSLMEITNRDLKRGDRVMRRLDGDEALAVFEQLEALGWVDRIPSKLKGSPLHWRVNPVVHWKFAERAKVEAARRAEVRQMIAKAVGAGAEP